MDPKNAVEIRNVSKSFKIEVVDRDRHGSLFNKNPMKTVVNKVLDDINLDIRKGEVLGILGRNGSGKSTLLSLIARIMEPDSGTIERSGRIASILELGMGFHPDMSGRENIYLKGELYGFSQAEMDARIDRIIGYSGISKYIDNPVRTYSSGMSGRLAFSVMMNVESEIMLVDEILSVGDATFTAKAKEHFRKLAKSGKTVVFVSHSIADMEEMCTRAVWIENGKIVRDGIAKDVCAEYRNKMSSSPEIVADLAEAGVADSQYELAMMYRDGTGFGQSAELYREWMKRASDQGHTLAQVAYADILMADGDESEAVGLYRSAANKGNADARRKISSLGKGRDELGEKVREIFLKMAEEGEPINMFRCADYLLKTAWTEEDRRTAFGWFERSAENGYPNAMHQVGLMYRDGLGTVRDYVRMAEWLGKAADMGFLPSVTLLADIYLQERLVPKDSGKAFGLYLKGAELGNGKCQYQVALMYRDGDGTDVDLEESDKWFGRFSRSATVPNYIWAADWASMHDVDSSDLAEMYKRACEGCVVSAISDVWNINTITEGQAPPDALANLELLASNGNIDAMRRLGDYYYVGAGIGRDYGVAMEWFAKAASCGDIWSMNRLGEMYRDGKGTGSDMGTAIEWFRAAADHGFLPSCSALIDMYVSGTIDDGSIHREAMRQLKNSALRGNSNAAVKFGDLLYNGFGVKRDCSEAVKWYTLAAKLGNLRARNRLAEIYRDGSGVPSDLNISSYWFSLC